MITRFSRRAVACALLATTALVATPAFGQAMGSGTKFRQIDDNGVDVSTGAFDLQIPLGSVGGNSPGALSFIQYLSNASGNNLQTYFRRSESGTQVTITLTFGSSTVTFAGAKTATSFTSDLGDGSTLTKNSPDQYTYRASDGTTAIFSWPSGMSYGGGTAAFCATGNEATCDLLVQSIVKPNGQSLNYDWHAGENCRDRTLRNGEIVQDCVDFYRISSVGSSGGWSIGVTYVNNADPTTFSLPASDWYKVNGATFGAGSTGLGSASIANPSSTLTQLTDRAGRTWNITRDATTQYVTAVKRPGSSTDNISMSRDTSGKVASITKDGVTTGYTWVDSGSTRTLTKTDALGHNSTITTDLTKGRRTAFINELGNTTSFTYDSLSRLTRTTLPEGNYTNLTYDARGNVTERRQVAKPASGLADIVETANYDSACASTITCNLPHYTIDPRGNQTDYTYDSITGEVLSVTRPAAAAGGIRPQTRYSYSQPNTGAPWMLTGVSQCQTGSSCTGSSDESKVAIGYDAKLLPTSITRSDGTGAVSSTSTMTYDGAGNLATVDGPLSGAADTTTYAYDSANQLLQQTDPDPDGPGATTLKKRSIKLTYRPDGQVSRQELGTVDDSGSFAAAQTVDIGYDANSRVGWRVLYSGSTSYALTHYNYDLLGRSNCTAVRMNAAVYSSLPDPCVLSTQGSDGPDRISQVVYDAASQPIQLKVAVGTSDAATERTLGYTANGQLWTLLDGENNLSAYNYDGFDRLWKVFYPAPTKGANDTNGSDYEQLNYDAAGNVTSRRTRAGVTLTYSYDNLNRVTVKVVPDSAGLDPYYTTGDVYYGYDLLGRLTFARFNSTSGEGITNSYDALSRLTTSTTDLGGVSRSFTSAYDAAGDRTALTGHAGYNAGFTYDSLGGMTSYLEGQTAPAVRIAYDDLGRRTSLSSGVGSVTSVTNYAYDGASRVASLTQDLAGTANDLTETFAYNPASQVTSSTQSNDAYAFTGHANINSNASSNGLNQLTTVGSTSLTYDANGNLSANGSSSYGYDPENRLVWNAASSTALFYDPLGRLWSMSTGATTRRFIYDGSELVREYDGAGTTLNSYVHGPAVDEVLVDYQDSPTSIRRFPHADRLGSIIALADDSGNPVAINRYDEHGNPQGGNVTGRFGYTGQAWLPEIGLQYSKARMYSPTLGRFMQTDPVGPADDPNLYAYTGNDPVNGTDPSGLTNCDIKDICVTGKRLEPSGPVAPFASEFGQHLHGAAPSASPGELVERPIVVVGRRRRTAAPPQEPPIVITAPHVVSPSPIYRTQLPIIAAAASSQKQDFCGSAGHDVPDGNWSEACAIHDRCYATPGAVKELCDLQLTINITAVCSEKTMLPAVCALPGIVYGGGLIFFGVTPFYHPSRDAFNRAQRGGI